MDWSDHSYLILLALLSKVICVSSFDRAIKKMWISSSFNVYLTLIDFANKSAFRRIPPIFHNIKLPLQSVWSPANPIHLHSFQTTSDSESPFPSPLLPRHTPSQISLLSDHCSYVCI